MADTVFMYLLYVRTLRRHCLLKRVIDEKWEELEDVSSYWMDLSLNNFLFRKAL